MIKLGRGWSVLLIGLLCAWAVTGMASTTWLGTVDNTWTNADNWSNGVPDDEMEVVLTAPTAEEFEIEGPGGTTTIEMNRIFVSADTPASSVTITHGGTSTAARDFRLMNDGTIIEMEAGAPALTLDVGGGRFGLSSTSATIINNSDNLLSFISTSSLFRRVDTVSGIRLDGSGNVDMTGANIQRTNAHFRDLTLLETFSGTLFLNANYNANSGQTANLITVDGGTLVMNGEIQTGALIVNEGGTFSGTGSSQRAATFNEGAVVNPGTVGGTGTFTFTGDNTVAFEAGSLLRLDLLNPGDHDRLLFAEFEEDTPSLSLATSGDGVVLDLNLLSGFAADIDDEFAILAGFSGRDGLFRLPNGTELADNDEFTVDGTAFRINYSNPSVTLTVIPEPGTGGVLLLGLSGLGLAVRRYASRHD